MSSPAPDTAYKKAAAAPAAPPKPLRDDQRRSDGRLLIWEYPRETPKGDQTDIVESMDLENGLITHHRVYWGCVGFNKLHNAINKARQ